MGFIKNIIRKNNYSSSIILIYCSTNKITINGIVISFPTHIDKLIEIFGKPSKQKHEYLGWYVVWDSVGVYLDCGTLSSIISLKFLKSNHHKLKHYPSQLFKGKILVNNKEIQNSDFETIEILKHSVSLLTYKGEKEPYTISIGVNFNYKEEIPKDKYIINPLDEEIIEFKDFNFKLAILQVLMYDKELLTPKFDLYEFVAWYQEREIDIEEEGYEFIPEVTQYFKDFPIPKKLAPEVTEIYQDGGNNIYVQMLRFTDGTDGYFEIESVEDAQHFKNLKKVTLMFYNDNKMLNAFKAKGIEARYL